MEDHLGLQMNQRILFLCTGNYYRSRFAEYLFNSIVAETNLNWEACSRGIATELGMNNIGPISPQVVNGLEMRGININRDISSPIQLQERDLEQSDLIIAMNEEEHQPYLKKRFPKWAARVKYWHIRDLNLVSADEELPQIEREVHALVQQLTQDSGLREVLRNI